MHGEAWRRTRYPGGQGCGDRSKRPRDGRSAGGAVSRHPRFSAEAEQISGAVDAPLLAGPFGGARPALVEAIATVTRALGLQTQPAWRVGKRPALRGGPRSARARCSRPDRARAARSRPCCCCARRTRARLNSALVLIVGAELALCNALAVLEQLGRLRHHADPDRQGHSATISRSGPARRGSPAPDEPLWAIRPSGCPQQGS